MNGDSREQLLRDLREVTERLERLEQRIDKIEGTEPEPPQAEPPPPPPTPEPEPEPNPEPQPAAEPGVESEPVLPAAAKGAEESAEPPGREPLAAESFLTEEEAHGLPNPLVDAIGKPPRGRTGSVEVDFATVWLPRIGGVLLLIGAALGAMYIGPSFNPLGRVVCGYLITAGVGILGFLARRRSFVYAQAAWAIALSLGHFVSFATYFLPPMQVFTSFLPALFLMAGFAGTLIGLADRWRSQPLAAFGFILAVLAALVSASSSEIYALVALVILAIAATVLLLRREWLGLTALALAGTYLGSALLWAFFPPEAIPAVILAHLAALVLYHLVFALAFHRWGRVWIARERAMEQSAETIGMARRDSALLPLSSAFPMINSLALASLSLLLLHLTELWWDHLDILLFALAAGELIRLPLRNTLRADLWQYHLLTGLALVTAGIVAALGGMERSGVLAAQTLILAVAGSRSRSLRFLRPLSLLPALLSLNMVATFGALTAAGIFAGLTACAMLLASALPWERILNRGREWEKGRLLRWAEIASGQVRALVAITTAAVILLVEFSYPDSHPFLLLLAVLSVLGTVLLRAGAWTSGALFITFIAAPVYSMQLTWNPAQFVASGALALVLFRLWQEGRHHLAVQIMVACIAALLAWVLFLRVPLYTELRGLTLLAFAGVCYTTFRLFRDGRLPALVRDSREEDAPASRWKWPPLLILSGLFLLGATFFAALVDSRAEMLTPVLVGLCWTWLWFVLRSRFAFAGLIYTGIPALLYCALLVHGEGAAWASALILPLCLALFALAWRLKRPLEAQVAMLFPALIPIHFATILLVEPIRTPGWPVILLVESLLLLALPPVYRWMDRRGDIFPGNNTFLAITAEQYSYWMVSACGAVLLGNWALGGLLPEHLVTVAWGVSGIAFLVAGLILVERPMRLCSLAILALTIGRIFFVDLANADTLARVIAFLATGVVFILAGVTYVFLKNRAR